MRRANWTVVVAFSALLLAALASGAAGQKAGRAPFVHIYSRAGDVVSNYIEPSIEVGEDAYVFAVALDLNGQIQVLHPEYAGISVRLLARRELQLKNFFAGFDHGSGRVYSRGRSSSANYEAGYGDDDTRGVIIALASRAPFNFDRLQSGGDWNISTIRNLTERRSPTVAARNLAQYIGAPGEPIGRDFMRFGGGRDDRYAYVPDAFFSQCDLGYAYGLGGTATVNQQRTAGQIAYLQSKGQNVRIVGYDVCGRPIVSYGPGIRGEPRLPGGRIPHRFPGDTTVFPKTQGIPATGGFPTTRGAGTIPSAYPGTRTAEEPPADPRVIFAEPRRRATQPAPAEPVYVQPSRIPRTEPTRAPAEIPSAPRNEPRVINEPAQGSLGGSRGREEATSPQPRIIEAPPPVQREAPVQRAEPPQREAPPPRAEPTPRAEPAPPPPSKTEPAAPPPGNR